MPFDSFRRHIDYMRVSVTDRCNLKCVYCNPEDGAEKLAHNAVLSYEEMLHVIRIALSMGISKIRLTGGEPLVRKGLTDFCRRIAELPGLKNFSLTTNGVFLEEHARDIYEAGIHRINISLDTLHRQKFIRITQRDKYNKVWRGIRTAEDIGFYPIKLNVVVMRGINDDEILNLAQLTKRHAYHIRFIEYMPFQTSVEQMTRHCVSSDEILKKLNSYGPLKEVTSRHTNSTARYYQWSGAMGKIGLISPMSRHFCDMCNRIRLTADGKLRSCLFSDQEIDIKQPLRQGVNDSELVQIIWKAVLSKQKKYVVKSGKPLTSSRRPMVAIGG